MRPGPSSLDFETVCKYVGQLFLESRNQLEQPIQQAKARESELTLKLENAERERDDALKLLHELRSKPKV